MNKVEFVSPDLDASYVNADGDKASLFVGLVLSDEQLATVKISVGSIVYTVNEQETKSLEATPAPAKTNG